MIISCEQCSTKFQVPDDRITDAGVRARCSRCGAVFSVMKARVDGAGVSAPSSNAESAAGSVAFSSETAPRKTQPFPFGAGRGASGAPTTEQNPFARSSSPEVPLGARPTMNAPLPAALASSAPAATAPAPPAPFMTADAFPRPKSGALAKPPAASVEPTLLGSTGTPATHATSPTATGGAPQKRPPSSSMANPFAPPVPPSASTAEVAPAFEAPRTPFSSAARPPSGPSPRPSSPTDPFGGSLLGGSPSPFGAVGGPFGAPSSPFSPQPTPSRFGPAAGAAGFDDRDLGSDAAAADPFRAPAAPQDPFSSGMGGAPFAGVGALDPFATKPPAFVEQAQQQIADELFGDPSMLRSSSEGNPPPLPFGFDTLGDDDKAPGFAVPPSGELPATTVHDVPDILREQAKPEPVKAAPAKPRRKPLRLVLRPLVGPVASVANAAVFVCFVVSAIVIARGGGVDDLHPGRVVEILLGDHGASADDVALMARDVVVRRYPVDAAPDLVVITGLIENRTDSPVERAVVEVAFGETQRFTAPVGALVTPLDLVRATDRAAVLSATVGLAARPLAPRATTEFVVLAHDVDEGARAEVTVRDASRPRSPHGR